jgi:hypothetical protein
MGQSVDVLVGMLDGWKVVSALQVKAYFFEKMAESLY